jgi:predicted ATPase
VDPETLHALRHHLCTLAQHIVQRYEGTIQQVMEQGVLACFGAVVPHEDHAQRAVLAAMCLRGQLQQTLPTLPPLAAGALAVCMAVHTGAAIVGPLGTDPRRLALTVDDTPQILAHLLRLAAPGAILLSHTTGPLVRATLRLEALGPLSGRGTPRAQRAYQVLGRRPQRVGLAWQGRRARRVFVGRARELATLHALLAQVEDGHGQVVGITGEPGIGKSRLLYEFRHQVRATPTTYRAGRCVSYGQATPYLPLLDLLRQACGLTASDAPDAVRAQVRRALHAVGLAPEAWAPSLLRLLGTAEGTASLEADSPQDLRTQTFEALLQLHLRASYQQPLLLAVEDVHWSDPTSEAWLLALVERLAGARVLLVLSYRAGYQPAWLGKSYATQLALPRLRVDDSRRLVRAVLPARMVTADLVQRIEAHGDGNPFFLEELAQAVVEHGDAPPTLRLPATVQAVVAARLDRLPPEAKALVQVAAVVGREVSGALLQAVTGLAEAPLRQHLRRLQDAEVLYEARLVPEAVYAFKHALTHEVAYQSLLRHARQQVHRQIAEVLVAQFPAGVTTQPEVLAHHATEAGLPEQALAAWQRAGERTIAQAAYGEAVQHLTKGLTVLHTLPDTPAHARRELDLQLALGDALRFTRGQAAPEVGQAALHAQELCQRVGDVPQRLVVLSRLATFHNQRAEHETARTLLDQYLTLAHDHQDLACLVRGHVNLGGVLFTLGELSAAQGHLARGLTLMASQPERFHYHQVLGLGHLGQTLWYLGYPDQALTCMHALLTHGRASSHALTLTRALYYASRLHLRRREAAAAQTLAAAALALVQEHGFANYWGPVTFTRGWALVTQGQRETGQALMHQGLAAEQARGAALYKATNLALFAEVYGAGGQAEAGLRLLAEARGHVHHTGERIYAAEVSRLTGELLLRQAVPDAPQAESCFHQALTVARCQQAKSLELRAAMSLSRLWEQQGKRAAARALLAPVYGWFTEGVDTADLQEARKLLHTWQGS